MKKLLIIHHSSIISGAGISLLNLIKLAKKTYSVTVYVSDVHDDYYNLLISNDINVKKYKGRIPGVYYHASSAGIYSIAFWHRLVLMPIKYNFWKKEIQNSQADLVLVNSLVLCWMSIFTSKFQMKSLCFVRETFSNNGLDSVSKLQRRLLTKFTGVSFISRYDLKVAKLTDAIRTYVNHNYIIPKQIKQTPEPEKTCFSVLYIGGISRIKGIEVIINAALSLKSYTDIEFNIVGQDYSSLTESKFQLKNLLNSNFHLSKRIKGLVRKNDLENTVVFHGIQKEMQSYFRECDVLVCPITTPHQQRGVFEAGWYSKPVIVSDFEQLHWSVKDGYNGLLFEPNNAEQLVEKILSLYHSDILAKAQGLNNNKLTLENHTKNKCVEGTLLTLEDILNA